MKKYVLIVFLVASHNLLAAQQQGKAFTVEIVSAIGIQRILLRKPTRLDELIDLANKINGNSKIDAKQARIEMSGIKGYRLQSGSSLKNMIHVKRNVFHEYLISSQCVIMVFSKEIEFPLVFDKPAIKL